MRTFLIASALSVLAAPASAQMMGGMGGGMNQSCVSGGQFVPCGAPAMGMQQGGGGMSDGMMEPKRKPRMAKRMSKKRM